MEAVVTKLNNQFKSIKQFLTKHDFRLAIVLAIGLIILGVGLGWYNNQVIPVNAASSARYTLEPSNHLSFMSNWDGPDYLQIASSGYGNIANTNFFPLYPLLVHLVHLIIPSLVDSGLIVAWISLVGAIYFYIKIIRIYFHPTNTSTIKALMLFTFFPTAVFLLATYTESLFACLALGAIYFALKKKLVPAALLALFMTATHVTGVFVLALIALILLEEKVKLSKIILTVIGGSLGLLGFMFYLLEQYHRPLAFISAQINHGWLSHTYSNLFPSLDLFSIIFIILTLAAAIYWWKKRLSLAIYSLLFLLIPTLGRQFGGFDRYVLMTFPIPLMLYSISRRHPNLYYPILTLSVIGWTFFMLQYAGGYIGG